VTKELLKGASEDSAGGLIAKNELVFGGFC